METFGFDLSAAIDFADKERYEILLQKANEKNLELENKTGLGNDFLGWVDLPVNISDEQLNEIQTEAKRLSSMSDVLVVVGIGGSFLGAKSALEALKGYFDTDKVIFAGTNLSERYLFELLEWLDDKDFSLCVISKSGTTLEPALAFRFLREKLYAKYGQQAAQRVVAVTNPNKGALLTLARQEGYKVFSIPDDVGGRYSIFTPAGLLPMAFASIDIKRMILGAALAVEKFSVKNKGNFAEQYAAIRNALYEKDFGIEILTNYSPNMTYIARWWQQLFGESEGKDGKGIFPAFAEFTADLHSLGQYLQQGKRNLIETVLKVDEKPGLLSVSQEKENFDGLNYLSGKYVEEINDKAFEGTLSAHVDGGVPNIVLHLPKVDEFNLGQLYYFFMRSCGISGYLLGVNPFDQPGVEAYKKNMFRLLGKPGF